MNTTPIEFKMEETYTFSRALHLMRYSGKKMRSVDMLDNAYIFVHNGRLCWDSGRECYLTSPQIMGSWVEVKE